MYIPQNWGRTVIVASADEINAALTTAEMQDRESGFEPLPQELTEIAMELDHLFEEDILSCSR